MAERSRPNKVADGLKATQTKIAQFGPAEPNRAADQAVWTKAHQNEPKSQNPHLRRKVYPPEILARVEKFKAWARAHPGRSDSENPHSWDKHQLTLKISN
jgi:hypothetical protein